MTYKVSTMPGTGQWCIKSERGLVAAMEAGSDSVRKADAELIVATLNNAPLLLKAAIAALEYLQAHPPRGKVKDIFTELNHHANGICKPLYEAISKAKGQP